MESDVQQALSAWTARYCADYQALHGTLPASEELYGIPSPCVVASLDNKVLWQPMPFTGETQLAGVEKALDIALQPDIHLYYTTQFAGDMPSWFDNLALTLLQPWSEQDAVRVQENLIGHLVTQKRLKLSPTLFIATLEDDLDVVSLCNLTGNIVRERLGTKQRTVLAPNLISFIAALTPKV